jgi:hypothetical protein
MTDKPPLKLHPVDFDPFDAWHEHPLMKAAHRVLAAWDDYDLTEGVEGPTQARRVLEDAISDLRSAFAIRVEFENGEEISQEDYVAYGARLIAEGKWKPPPPWSIGEDGLPALSKNDAAAYGFFVALLAHNNSLLRLHKLDPKDEPEP